MNSLIVYVLLLYIQQFLFSMLHLLTYYLDTLI